MTPERAAKLFAAANLPSVAAWVSGDGYAITSSQGKLSIELTVSESRNPPISLTVSTSSGCIRSIRAMVSFGEVDTEALGILIDLYASRDWETFE